MLYWDLSEFIVFCVYIHDLTLTRCGVQSFCKEVRRGCAGAAHIRLSEARSGSGRNHTQLRRRVREGVLQSPARPYSD